LKPKPQNLAGPKAAVQDNKKFAWWNKPQICSKLSQRTHGVHQSWRRTFWTFDWLKLTFYAYHFSLAS